MSAGLRTPDFGVIWLMIGAIIDAVRDVSPELWRRYQAIATQGLN